MTEYHFDELDETGKVVDTITRSGPATVGRQSKDSTSDIQIPAQCQSASRHHASIKIQGDQLVLEDHSSFGTIVNQILVERSSVPLHHGDEIVFGQSGDGWRVRFRGPRGADTTTTPADPLELLVVSEAPRQVRIGPNPLEEHLGRRAFALLRFLSAHQGSWYPANYLNQIIWPDQELAPLRPIEALSKYKKQINDLLKPYLDDQEAIESWVNRGYRLRPRLKE